MPRCPGCVGSSARCCSPSPTGSRRRSLPPCGSRTRARRSCPVPALPRWSPCAAGRGVAPRRLDGNMSTPFTLPGLERLDARRGAAYDAPRTDPRGAARGAQRAAARRRRARGCAAAGGGRRRLGQDPGADPADRLADLRAQRPPRLDPGDHLHQQGRRRDEGAGRGPGRQAGPDHVGLDVPLRLRADPAQGDTAHRGRRRLQVELLDLRRRRPEAADDPGRQGPRPRPEALPAGRGAALGLEPQERAARPRGGRPRTPATSSRRPTPRRTRSTSGGCARPTPSTSTT